MIFTLAYVSTMADSVTWQELEELLAGSRRRNAEADITGLLLYRQGRVMQILEGSESSVRELFGRIADDVRHHDVIQVWSSSAGVRRFAEWTMGFEVLSDAVAAEPPLGAEGDHALEPARLAAAGPGENAFVPAWTVERLDYDQRAFLDQRTAVLRRVLADQDRRVSALAVILYAHEPTAVLTENGVVLLHCRECRPEQGNHAHDYPCLTAQNCLRALEPEAEDEVA